MEYNQNLQASIIVVTWNSSERIQNCLDQLSLLQHLEIIVVDNASGDDTVNIIEENFTKIKLIKNSQNLGFAKAVNLGLHASHAPLVCLLNDDAILTHEKAQQFIDHFNHEEDLGVLGGQYIYPNGKFQNSIAAQPDLMTELCNKRLINFLFPQTYPHKRATPQNYSEVPSVIGACLWTRKEIMLKTGGLDESYFFYLEETDYCLQAKQLGFKVKFDPAIQIEHAQGASSKKIRTKAKIEYLISLQTYFRKNRGPFKANLLFMLRLLFLLPKTSVLSLLVILSLGMVRNFKKQASYYWKLLFWHLRFCPQNWGMRS
jgi:GT2 family glycosyltransferase